MQEAQPAQKVQANKIKASTIFFVVATFLLASILISFGRLGWPGLHWDAALYGTPVINVANGKGWTFGSYTRLIAEKDTLTYNFHGLLHALFYGSLLKAGTWGQYLRLQGLVNAFTFALYSSIYAVHICRLESRSLKPFFLSILLGSVPALICIGLQGRPEQLAPLILTIPLLADLVSGRTKVMLLALGTCLGLLVILSPLVGIVFFVYLVGRFFVRNVGNISGWFRDLGVSALLGSVVASAIISLFTPFQPWHWAAEIASSGDSSPLRFEGILMMFSQKWGGSFTAPLWNLACIAFIAAALLSIWRVRQHRLLAMLPIVASAIYINQKAVDYTYLPFLPFAIALCLASPGSAWKPEWRDPKLPSTFQLGLWVLGSLYMFVILAYFAISFLAPFEQLSLEQARANFRASVAGSELAEKNIAIGYPPQAPSLVVLGDAGLDLISLYSSTSLPSGDIWIDRFEKKSGRTVKYFLLPQKYTLRAPAPPNELYVGRSRYVLLKNNWVGHPAERVDKIMRPLTLSDRYNYAIYQRSAT